MKNFVLALTLAFFSACNASGGHTGSPLSTAQDSIPPYSGFVNDFEELLSPGQEQELDSIVRSFEKKTGIEIAIVTIDSSMTTDADFEDYTLRIGKTWGVGKKDKNNGVVIGVSRSLRHIRIQNGFGIEKMITDAETGAIIDNEMIPAFKEGNYFGGIRQGLLAMIAKLDSKK